MKTRTRAFTLVELLVVIAIIALLAAILLPVLTSAKESAYQAQDLSNGRQIGMALRLYASDYDDAFPLLRQFNTDTPRHDVPDMLRPYTKTYEVFRCPKDTGSPFVRRVLRKRDYVEAYGSSYYFTFCLLTHDPLTSKTNDGLGPSPDMPVRLVTDSVIEFPSETRFARTIMMPWFEQYIAENRWYPDFFELWFRRGGSVVFADGHARFVTSRGQFEATRTTPEGDRTLEVWDRCY